MSAHLYVQTHLGARGVTGWVVRVGLYRAINLKKADKFGKSDPYAIVYINGIRRCRSNCVKKTLNPHWEQVIEFAIFKEDLGSASIASSTFSLALFDMDKVGKHDFLGGTELRGSDFMNFAAFPLKQKPKWQIGDRLREFDLKNLPSLPDVNGVRGRVAFWAEIRPDEESERNLAALKIQSIHRGGKERQEVKRQLAARKIQARQRGKRQLRQFEKTKHAYMAFSIACSHIKKWAEWNDVSLDEIFDDMDRDKDGGLSVVEIKKFFTSHPSVDLMPEDVEAILFHMDPNNDGTIEEKEFISTIRKSDEVTSKIKEEWKKHLKHKSAMLRVREMGRAWRKAAHKRAKTKADGDTTEEGYFSVGSELKSDRRRRASRWSAEFEHLKAQHQKKHEDHKKKKLTAEERRVSLHKQWRRESKRRMKAYQKSREDMQSRLLKEQSERLRTLSSTDDEIEDELGLGYSDDDDGYTIYVDKTHDGDPRRQRFVPSPPSNKKRGEGALRVSPRASRIDAQASRYAGKSTVQIRSRPRSPSELENIYKFFKREVDLKTKRVFFQNYNTGETVWNLPPGAIVYPPPPVEEPTEPQKISPFTFGSHQQNGSNGPASTQEVQQDSGCADQIAGSKPRVPRDKETMPREDYEALAESLGSMTAIDFNVATADFSYDDYRDDYENMGDYEGENFESDYDIMDE